MIEENKPIALIDLDGTLVDYEDQLRRDLDKLKSPNEPSWEYRNEPDYVLNRMNLIRKDPSWWENLPPIENGMILVKLMREIGFRLVVCTQGPRLNPDAWNGKVRWCLKNLPERTDIVITRDKGLVYGSVLMDDYPDYVTNWLKNRPRGLVIMPVHPYNMDFSHPNVIKWDGSSSSLKDITANLNFVYKRKTNKEDML